MTVETATYISQLNTSYPETGSNKTEGDNHIRLIKRAIQKSFANIDGEVSANAAELNLFNAGGTVSGALTVKGTLSVSGSVYAREKIDLSVSASPTATGAVIFDQADKVLKIGANSATRSFPTDQSYMVASGAYIYDSALETTASSYPATDNSYRVAFNNYDGLNWLNSLGYITVPSGAYEMHVQLAINASMTGTSVLKLTIKNDNQTYSESWHGYSYSSESYSAAINTQFAHLSLSGALTIRITASKGDGSIYLQSASASTKVMVKRI